MFLEKIIVAGALVAIVIEATSVSPSKLPTNVPTSNPTTFYGASCPAGWTTYTDRCFLVQATDTTWYNCQSFCGSKGGYMPCFNSVAVSTFLGTVVPSTYKSTYANYNDLAQEGSFAWNNGCQSTYTHWTPGNPDNWNNNEDCTAVSIEAPNYYWNDTPCNEVGAGCSCERPFITSNIACPIGWTLSDDSTTCYYFENVGSTFTTCESTCAAKGATSLCIQNSVQNAFVYKMRAGRDTWIGMRRTSGPWTWPAGCTSTYVTWASSRNEPSSNSDELYTFMQATAGGQWYDMSNQPVINCACQKPAFVRTESPTAIPTIDPSASPTMNPSTAPTAIPTAPTAAPTVLPTQAPSANPTTATFGALVTSPTLKVKSGFAFAVLAADGSVYTWGEAGVGGDSAAVAAQLTTQVRALSAARGAFAALKSDGTITPWGVVSTIRDENTAHPPLLSLIANEAAFAGIVAGTGAVYALGAYQNGGNVLTDAKCNGFATQLSSGVVSIAATSASFAALKADGTVYTWGNRYAGGGVSTLSMPALVNVVLIVATMDSFAALLSSGQVLTWGGRYGGGDSSSVAARLSSDVVHLIAAKSVFVAFKRDTSIVVWGNPRNGGEVVDSSLLAQLSANVMFVAYTFAALAAVKVDGSVVAWGNAKYGGDTSAVQSMLVDVKRVFGNGYAFAALTSTGSVVTWGDAECGGVVPANKVGALSSDVVSIYHTDRAFAALKTDGSVVVWGQAGHGGNPGAAVEALLVSGVHTICSNDAAFSAIKTDGSVVGWGHPVSIPTAGVQLTSASLSAAATCA